MPAGLPSSISGAWRFPSTTFRRTVLPIAPKVSKSPIPSFPDALFSSSRLGRAEDPEAGATVMPGPPPLTTSLCRRRCPPSPPQKIPAKPGPTSAARTTVFCSTRLSRPNTAIPVTQLLATTTCRTVEWSPFTRIPCSLKRRTSPGPTIDTPACPLV
jgi:hypothetical protein